MTHFSITFGVQSHQSNHLPPTDLKKCAYWFWQSFVETKISCTWYIKYNVICIVYYIGAINTIHLKGEIVAFQRVSECLKNNIPIIATVGHGKLAYFLKYVVDHFGTAKPTPTTSETYSKEHHEGHVCFCALDRTKVDSCPDVKYQLQTMFPDSLKKDLDDCLSGLSEVIQYSKFLSHCQYWKYID